MPGLKRDSFRVVGLLAVASAIVFFVGWALKNEPLKLLGLFAGFILIVGLRIWSWQPVTSVV